MFGICTRVSSFPDVFVWNIQFCECPAVRLMMHSASPDISVRNEYSDFVKGWSFGKVLRRAKVKLSRRTAQDECYRLKSYTTQSCFFSSLFSLSLSFLRGIPVRQGASNLSLHSGSAEHRFSWCKWPVISKIGPISTNSFILLSATLTDGRTRSMSVTSNLFPLWVGYF